MFAVMSQITDRGANVQLEQYLETSGSSDKRPAGVSYALIVENKRSVRCGLCGGVGAKYRKKGM
jgi:hypothetical protein